MALTRNIQTFSDRSRSATIRKRRATIVSSSSLRLEQLEERVLLAADFGDAPFPFPTLELNQNGLVGASHANDGPVLGVLRDEEENGLYSDGALGDGDDEDGVVWTPLHVGRLNIPVSVTVNHAPNGARLDAWIDFDHDRVWGKLGEQILNSVAVVEGVNELLIDVPAYALAGDTFARFRISTDGNLGPAGAASDGEVEDYAVSILPPTGTDRFDRSQLEEYPILEFSRLRRDIVPADIDGDGDTDLVTLESRTGIQWHEMVDGQFLPAQTLVSSRQVSTLDKSLAASDVDQDGDADLVWFNGESLNLLRSNGDLSFEQEVLQEASLFQFHLTDYDQDGDEDIVFSTETINQGLSILRNENGEFESVEGIQVPVADIHIGDLDGDEDVDFVFESERGVYRVEQTDNGSFLSQRLELPFEVVDLEMIQLDGRAQMIVVSTNPEPRILRLDLQPQRYQIFVIEARSAAWVQSDDYDNDGDHDFYAYDASQLTFYENIGDTTLQAHQPFSVHLDELSRLEVGNLDLDPEIETFARVKIEFSRDDRFFEFFAGTTPSLIPETFETPPAWPPFSFIEADFDNDADFDFFTRETSAPTIQYENRLNEYHEFASFRLRPASEALVEYFDLDEDGIDDLLGWNRQVIWYQGNENGYTYVPIFEGCPSQVYVQPVDLDADGDLDLISRCRDIYWHENMADGTFSHHELSLTHPPRTATYIDDIEVADVDSDGDLDVAMIFDAIGREKDSKIVWFENQGLAQFEKHTIDISIPLEHRNLHFIDIDGDGDQDFLTTGQQPDDASMLFMQTGPLEFTTHALLGSVTATHDFNKDGRYDFAVNVDGKHRYYWADETGEIHLQELPFNVNPATRIFDVDQDGDLDFVSNLSGVHVSKNKDALLSIAADRHEADELENSIVRFVITREIIGTESSSISFEFGGDAKLGVDYTVEGVASLNGNSGTVAFDVGQESATISVTVLRDDFAEPNESIKVTLVDEFPSDFDFVNKIASTTIVDRLPVDYGDAPVSYGAQKSDFEAAHQDRGPMLGTTRSVDQQYLPSAVADADNDDGVSFDSLRQGSNESRVIATVSNAPDGAILDAWMDFNGDGAWSVDEQILRASPVVEGENRLPFSIPFQATTLPTFARIRISTAGGLSQYGTADDGEVEDYAVTIAATAPKSFTEMGRSISELAAIADQQIVSWKHLDFDDDGDQDFLVNLETNRGRNTGWIENLNGDTFLYHELAQGHRFLGAADPVDIDGDGDQDIVSSDGWRENLTGGRFRKHVVTENGSITHAVDVTGDGLVDFVATKRIHARLWVKELWVNQGNGRFEAQDLQPASLSGLAKDLDSDGDIDFVQSRNNRKTEWYENLGNATFRLRVLDEISVESIEDIDNDGDQDIVGSSDGFFAWLENDGQNHFVSRKHDIGHFKMAMPIDLNNDGINEIVKSTEGELEFLDFTLDSSVFIDTDLSGHQWRSTDLNHDGVIDFVTTDGDVNFMFESAADSYLHVTITDELPFEPIESFDLDQDGQVDLAAADLARTIWYTRTDDSRWQLTSQSFASADLDRDGNFELIGYDDDGLYVIKTIAESQSAKTVIDASLEWASAIHAIDVNRDGSTDLVVLDNNRQIWLYSRHNENALDQNDFFKHLLGAGFNTMVPVDFDWDGDVDFVGKGWPLDARGVFWLKNTGPNQFIKQELIQETDLGRIAIADTNGDGHWDVTVDLENGKLVAYENDGNGTTFTPLLIADGTPRNFGLADVDADGDVEFITAEDAGIVINERVFGRIDIRVSESEVVETDAQVTFSIRRSTTNGSLTVELELDGTATHEEDFLFDDSVAWNGNNGTVTFADGQANIEFSARIINDDTPELHETIAVRLIQPRKLMLGNSTASMLILDEDLADFGDSQYEQLTSKAFDAAFHVPVGPILGSERNAESDRKAIDDADDGIRFETLQVGKISSLHATVANSPMAVFNGWIDFDGDGSWAGKDEHVFSNVELLEGEHELFFQVPPTSAIGTFQARFRLTSHSDIGITGIASDGEVEDYAVQILPPRMSAGMFAEEGHLIENLPADVPIGNVAAADLDNDGDQDLLLTLNRSLYIYINHGRGEYEKKLIYDDPRVVQYVVTTADMDGDNDIDIVLPGRRQFVILTNLGNGEFESKPYSHTLRGEAEIFDVDNDGDQDVIMPSCGRGRITLFRNDGASQYSEHMLSQDDVCGNSTTPVDVDADGKIDLAFPGGWFRNVSTRTDFGFTTIVGSFERGTEKLADLDGNGLRDLIFDDGFFQLNDPPDFRLGELRFTPDKPYAIPVDMDSDGDLDILAVSSRENWVQWYENLDNSVSIRGPAEPSVEAVDPLVFTLQRFGSTEQDIQVTFSVDELDGHRNEVTATGVLEYDQDTGIGKALIPAGSEQARIHVISIADEEYEPVEIVHVRIIDADVPVVGVRASGRFEDNARYELGDAPAPYASNSTYHRMSDGPVLGQTISFEPVFEPLPDGSDHSDDGVTFSNLRVGQTKAWIDVEVSNAPNGAYLDAWIDFNQDSYWGGGWDHILHSVPVQDGASRFYFDIPSWARSGQTHARFRITSAGNVGFQGIAEDGEIEDYSITIDPPSNVHASFVARRLVDDQERLGGIVTVADIDDDGSRDVVSAIDATYGNGLGWYAIDPEFGHVYHEVDSGPVGYNIAIKATDISGDGLTDIQVASTLEATQFFSNSQLVSYIDNGPEWKRTSKVVARSFALADYQSDGVINVITETGQVYALRDNEFELSAQIDLEGTAYFLEMASLNYDGQFNLVGLNAFHSDIDSWTVDKDAQVIERTVLGNATPNRIAAADLDLDGDLDVISTNGFDIRENYADSIVWFENQGEEFVRHSITSDKFTVADFNLADLDGDGDLDIFAAKFDRSEAGANSGIVWFTNEGNGQFIENLIDLGDTNPVSVSAADIDNDGDLDLIHGNARNYAIGWIENVQHDGDLDQDGQVNARDIDLLAAAIANGLFEPRFDIDRDGDLDNDDREVFIRDIVDSVVGDSNLDGRFDSADLVAIFQAGEYEDSVVENSGWSSGDWNGDGEFDSADLVYAFQQGNYTAAMIAARTEGIEKKLASQFANHDRELRTR